MDGAVCHVMLHESLGFVTKLKGGLGVLPQKKI